MNDSFRRFEILLPQQFNDGQPVPNELIGETLIELRRRFGAVSSETQIIRGTWEHEDQVFRDDLVRVFVDVPDTPANRQFFQSGSKSALSAKIDPKALPVKDMFFGTNPAGS